MSPRCPHCGAALPETAQRCPYCGAENPFFQPVERRINHHLEAGQRAFRDARYAEAIEHYREVLRLDPQLFAPRFYLADCLQQLGRWEAAIETMEQALALRPESASAHYNLGLLLRQAGRQREARAHLEAALRLVEHDPLLTDPARMRARIREALDVMERSTARA